MEVTKAVDWNGVTPDSNQTFEICITGPSYPTGTETGSCQLADFDGETLTWSNLLAGDYIVSETDPGSNWSVQIAGSPASVVANATAQATVTNTHAAAGSITIKKNVDDDNFADLDFDFLFNGDTPFSISENDAAGYVVSNLPPGNYPVTESVPDDWDLSTIDCGTGNNNTALVNGVTVVLDPGEDAVCTFNNRFEPTYDLRVIKYNDLDEDGTNNELNIAPSGGSTGNALTGWEFTVYDSNGALVDSGTTSIENPIAPNDLGTRINFPDLTSNETYIICETEQAGWVNSEPGGSGVTDPDANQDRPCKELTASSTTIAIIYFGNYQALGSMEVTKAVDWNGVTPDSNQTFEICITGPSYPTGTETGSCQLADFDGETLTWSNLLAGDYIVSETDPGSNWSVQIAGSPASVVADGTAQATVTNTRTGEPPAVRLVESYLVSRVEEGKITGKGSVACYWITLNSYSGQGEVVVDIGQPQNDQVTVNKSTVVLNSNNWNNLTLDERSNFVCIRPVDDQVADGGAQICRDRNSSMIGSGGIAGEECGDHIDSIPHSIASATAPGYGTATPIERLLPNGTNTVQDPNLPVLVQDNDGAGVVLTESHGVSDVDEDGGPVSVACYWVTLTSQPTGEVTVTPLPDAQVTVQPSILVLNSLNWNALGAESNKLCIYPVQDESVEGTANQLCADKKADIYGTGGVERQVCGSHLGAVNHSFSSSDPLYNGAGVAVSGNGPDFGTGAKVIDVLVRDDDEPGLVFQPAALSVLEGTSATYSIALESLPIAEVVAATRDGQTLTFTPRNWNMPQSVTVAVPEDNVVNGVRNEGLTHTVTSGDPAYNGLSSKDVTLPVTISDDDVASAITSKGSVNVAEGGATDGYSLRLTVAPSADVVVTLDGAGQVTLNPGQLTFTPNNWAVEQSVTVTAVEDLVDEGATANVVIGHTASSGDAAYDGAVIGDVVATVTDNDEAGLAISTTAVTSIVEGTSTTYEATLASQPTAAVVVTVVTDGKTTATPAQLTFDGSNWNVAQTVTLTAVDDAVDNPGDMGTSLVDHVVTSPDAAYNNVMDIGLSLDVVDNDVAGIQLSQTNISTADNSRATYSLVLTSEPASMVVVEVAPSSGVTVDAGCATEATEGLTHCLVFTPDNWAAPQQLTLTTSANGPGFVNHKAMSGDQKYNGLNVRLQINGVTLDNPVFLPLVAGR